MGIEGFGKRLFRAHRAYEDRLGRKVTQTDLGLLVGEELLRMGYKPKSKDDKVTQQSVGRWFGGTLPDHPRMVALAKVLGVDPGWLGYGPGGDEGDSSGNVLTAPPKRPLPTVERGNLDDHGVDVPIQRGKKKHTTRNRPGDRTARAG